MGVGRVKHRIAGKLAGNISGDDKMSKTLAALLAAAVMTSGAALAQVNDGNGPSENAACPAQINALFGPPGQAAKEDRVVRLPGGVEVGPFESASEFAQARNAVRKAVCPQGNGPINEN